MNSKPPQDDAGGALLDALVAGERASMEPPSGAQRDTWSRVAASVAAGTAAPVPASVTGPAATASAPWIKLVLGVILGGMFAVAAYQLGREPAPTPTETTAAAPMPQPGETAPSAPAAPQPATARNAPPPPAEAALTPPESAPLEPKAPVAHKPRVSPPEGPPVSDLAEETRLLAQARGRVRAGFPGEALAPLADHARRFPNGQLAEDRMALRAQALCESGDTTAGRKSVAALRKAFPSSSHLPRVNRSCTQ